jgi:hypothetical protein
VDRETLERTLDRANRERDIAAVRQRRETALSDDDLRDVYRSLRDDGRGHFAADRLTAQRFGVDRDRVRQAITQREAA